MKVSVIVPSFNRRALTSRAVQSVLNQTYRDLEILVIDDASRKEELYEPAPADADRVRVIRHDANGGVSVARNTGIKEATGPLVAFLDSDDYWFPAKLEEQVRLFLEQKDPGRTLLYGPYYKIGEISYTRTPIMPLAKGQKVGDYILINYGCLHVNTWLGLRDYLAQFPFDPGLRNAEEWDVVLRMEAAGGNFLYCPNVGSVRNVDLREDRLSTRANIESRRRFLAQNIDRLSLPAHAVLDFVTTEDANPSGGRWQWLNVRLKFFLSHAGLNPAQRVALLMRYVAARTTHKIKEQFIQRNLDKADFVVPEVMKTQMKME